MELNLLTFIKEKDEENLTNIVKISDFVIFRNHVVRNYLDYPSASFLNCSV